MKQNLTYRLCRSHISYHIFICTRKEVRMHHPSRSLFESC